jgi:hypothetical protein
MRIAESPDGDALAVVAAGVAVGRGVDEGLPPPQATSRLAAASRAVRRVERILHLRRWLASL